MAFPWLRVLDAMIGVTDLARSRRIGRLRAGIDSGIGNQEPGTGNLKPGNLETRLAGVVVAALKEAFDRDTRRIDLEREQMEAERRRAERAMRVEILRQAADREIGRLRLIAGIAVATWIGTLFFVGRLSSAAAGARFTFGVGWMLLLGAIAASLSAQGAVAAELSRILRDASDRSADIAQSTAGAIATWLLVAAMAIVGLVALVL